MSQGRNEDTGAMPAAQGDEPRSSAAVQADQQPSRALMVSRVCEDGSGLESDTEASPEASSACVGAHADEAESAVDAEALNTMSRGQYDVEELEDLVEQQRNVSCNMDHHVLEQQDDNVDASWVNDDDADSSGSRASLTLEQQDDNEAAVVGRVSDDDDDDDDDNSSGDAVQRDVSLAIEQLVDDDPTLSDASGDLDEQDDDTGGVCQNQPPGVVVEQECPPVYTPPTSATVQESPPVYTPPTSGTVVADLPPPYREPPSYEASVPRLYVAPAPVMDPGGSFEPKVELSSWTAGLAFAVKVLLVALVLLLGFTIYDIHVKSTLVETVCTTTREASDPYLCCVTICDVCAGCTQGIGSCPEMEEDKQEGACCQQSSCCQIHDGEGGCSLRHYSRECRVDCPTCYNVMVELEHSLEPGQVYRRQFHDNCSDQGCVDRFFHLFPSVNATGPCWYPEDDPSDIRINKDPSLALILSTVGALLIAIATYMYYKNERTAEIQRALDDGTVSEVSPGSSDDDYDADLGLF